LEDPEPRRRLAQLAAGLAGSQPRTVVAVTGTNGKTSTVEFLRQIWTAAGKRAASLGTLGLIAPGFDPGPGLTTPDPVNLAESLAQLAGAGVQHAAIEASSHGLDQFRLDGVRLAAGAFTNLTRDHLDYHRSEAAYRIAKLRLFTELLPAGAPVVASSDMDAETLSALTDVARHRRLDLRTVGEVGSTIRLLAGEPRPDGQVLRIDMAGVQREIVLPLPGRFQADNALMAAALASALGERDVLDRLASLRGVRGRLELAARLPNGAAVYVDYAHTPNALERLLTALRPHTTGRLHVVFGAGGDRDRGKRPLMGAAAARLADVAIVTDDNPRSEDPAAIRAAVLAACPGGREIGDRARAIAEALNGLAAGDVLAVAGKGHEQGQTVGNTVIPFDDVDVVQRLVRHHSGSGP
jgi:UDP-N-acetylmuramoyl-L-alanyl-D-glutamate--2,6-diaminopimelate ligase